MLHLLLERNLIPDVLVRQGIRRLIRRRLSDERQGGADGIAARQAALEDKLKTGPIAVHTDDANEQHYEVPPNFFQAVLGRHLKYSCALWEPGTETLDQAEEAMLAMSCRSAALANGQKVLELGCGWGSLTLYMAARYPASQITAVSNSHSQRQFILDRARERGLTNLTVITSDINQFQSEGRFDRIVSIEMFEHMRNYRRLMDSACTWLQPGGKLFVHVFAHKELAYLFEVHDKSDWMARHFFTGGLMPHEDLLPRFAGALELEEQWRLDGTHYQRTAEAWLANMDGAKQQIEAIFRACYGSSQVTKWWVYWRVFFMACAELWGYRGGQEWIVCHYRFTKPK